MKIDHPWKLAGPWYRWHDPDQVPLPHPLPNDGEAANPALGRLSRPIFQKYASSNFVEQFLDDPRCSLRFDQQDFVHEVIELPAAEVSKRRLSNKAYRRTAANRRKIFLNTHNRFYLVVCELHCDAPGFPNVSPDQTCEAGFVVRRRRAPIPATIRPELEVVLSKIARARYKIATSRRQSTTRKSRVPMMPQGTVDESYDAARKRQVERRSSQLQQAQAELQTLVQKHGIQMLVEGWVPSGGDGLGAWQTWMMNYLSVPPRNSYRSTPYDLTLEIRPMQLRVKISGSAFCQRVAPTVIVPETLVTTTGTRTRFDALSGDTIPIAG
jgi:hypothetical protein